MNNQLQHYVPQWYLKGFGSNSGRIRVVDRARSKCYVTNVSKAAAETGHYNYVNGDGETFGSIESDLSALESSAAKSVRRMLRNGLPISEAARHQVCAFVAAQFLRGPRRRDAYNRMTDQLVKADFVGMSDMVIADSLRERFDREPSSAEVDAHAEMLRDTDSYTVSDRNAPAKVLAENLEGVYNLIVGMYSLELISQPMPWLFTSDDPVCLVRLPGSPFPAWQGVGIGTADQILMPLDRCNLLVLHNSALHGEEPRFQQNREATEEDIEEHFFAVLRQSYKYIFLHPDEKWLDPADLPPVRDPIHMSGDLVEMVRKIRIQNGRP